METKLENLYDEITEALCLQIVEFARNNVIKAKINLLLYDIPRQFLRAYVNAKTYHTR